MAGLRASVPPPEYSRFLPADWRTAEPLAVTSRMDILARLGATPLVERLRLEWRPGTPIPPATQRLRSEPLPVPKKSSFS